MTEQRSGTSNIGVRIRDRRLAAGYTQGQLATYSKVSRSFITRLEQGDFETVSHDNMENIARALHCTVDELTGRADDDIDIDDPELDLLFQQAKRTLTDRDKRALKKQIRMALEMAREEDQQ